jgi:hypothetical protein
MRLWGELANQADTRGRSSSLLGQAGAEPLRLLKAVTIAANHIEM